MSEYSHQDINFHNISNIFFFRFNPSEFVLKQKILVTALNIIIVKQLFVIYAIFENIFRYKNGELHYIHIAWSKNSNITMVTKIWIKKKKTFVIKLNIHCIFMDCNICHNIEHSIKMYFQKGIQNTLAWP